MNHPAADKAATLPSTADAAEAHEQMLLDEVLRQTPYIAAPRFAMPTSWPEVEAMAKRICDAGWCPKSHMKEGKPNQASVELAILQGMELKVSPLMAVQGIAIINGVPAIWGDLMLAVVTASGLLEWKKEGTIGDGTDMRAVCRVKRLGRPEPVERVFSWAMAVQSGLSVKQGPWKSYPSRMLTMRARSWALRDEFADILRGMASMEELRDSGALARAIEATDAQAKAGGLAASITRDLMGGGLPAGTLADVHYPTAREREYRTREEVPASEGGTKTDAEDPSDDAAKINTPAGETVETVDEDGVVTEEPAANRPKSSDNPAPAPTGDLLGPTEAEWTDAAQAMLDRIDDCASAEDLAVLERSKHLAGLPGMATAAPQQHKAVAGFIAEKRKELGG